MSSGESWRPRLPSGALLRADPVRREDLMLLPERVVRLGGSAGDVLRRCDGHRTDAEIAAELAVRHPDAAADVRDFLTRLRLAGLLR
ncbi:pyrroloquinoline quinone biosynthesis peptide chaperone PqqD [Streptomyces boninensis]|uniref:pyrroloquinoline quinone biosynthesis peptide chaperone PqqD n=1 Tax=Streptomyces boninensis TaxID=2039455 RepID=UPI003B216ACF